MRHDGGVHLTAREGQVLRLVGRGLSTKQVALQLAIAPKTVEGYVERVKLILGAANRCHMISRAAGLGLLDAEGEEAGAAGPGSRR